MNTRSACFAALAVAAVLVTSACSASAPSPAPATAPAPAAATAKAAEPAKTAAPAAQPTAAPAKTVDFPQKGRSITVIVPVAAGGGSDTGARAMAALLEKQLGTPVEVVNKPGGGTQIGATEFAQSKPDGYTLLYGALQSFTVPYADPERKAAYNRNSFAPIARVTADPTNLAARADGPYKSLKDLVDAAKANPAQIKVAASTILSTMHLPVLLLEASAGARFAVVHFDGGVPGLAALLGGHIDAASAMSTDAGGHMKAGTLRILGVAGPEPIKQLPGVPTFESQGFKVQTVVSNVMAAPAGTPKEIVDILSRAVQKALQDPDLQQKYDNVGLTPSYMGPAQLAAFWDESDKGMPMIVDLFNKTER